MPKQFFFICILSSFTLIQGCTPGQDCTHQITDHISKDAHHTHVTCFFESPVEKRTFPHWNMALYGKKNNEIVNLYQLNEDEITSIENFFQDKITRYFKELVDYFKLTNTD
jgi:hypothetical protein